MKRSFLILTLLVAAGVAFAVTDEGYDPHGMRDPFLPLVTPAGAMITYESNVGVSEMALEGIMGDDGGRMAIINGNVVEPGENIGLYAIASIEADRVILLKDGEQSVLQLKKEE